MFILIHDGSLYYNSVGHIGHWIFDFHFAPSIRHYEALNSARKILYRTICFFSSILQAWTTTTSKSVGVVVLIYTVSKFWKMLTANIWKYTTKYACITAPPGKFTLWLTDWRTHWLTDSLTHWLMWIFATHHNTAKFLWNYCQWKLLSVVETTVSSENYSQSINAGRWACEVFVGSFLTSCTCGQRFALDYCSTGWNCTVYKVFIE